MRAASRYLVWCVAALMLVAWLLNCDQLEAFAFQRERKFRNISGIAVMTLILFQWSLTLGRTVFQKSGSQWGKWIDWHLRISLLLPLAVLVHSIAIGWGLLALLPLALLASGHFGSMLEGEENIRKHLPYHIGLSVATLVMALAHVSTVLMFN